MSATVLPLAVQYRKSDSEWLFSANFSTRESAERHIRRQSELTPPGLYEFRIVSNW